MKKPTDEIYYGKENKSNLSITIFVIVLFFLILFSMLILFTRLAVSLPFTDDTFVVNPKFDSVEFKDDEVIWDVDTEITIFKFKKIDENGNILVESIDGDKIIAPGMSGDYRFEIKNYGKFAVDTTVLVNCYFTVNGEEYKNCPIEIRLTDYTGEYVNDDWTKVSEVSAYKNELTIAKKHYIYYTLDWKWNYLGDDTLDTLLGNLSVNNDVEFKVSIVASATRSADKNSEGGLEYNEIIQEVGLLDIRPFIAFNVIAFLIIVALLIYKDYKRKQESKKYSISKKK